MWQIHNGTSLSVAANLNQLYACHFEQHVRVVVKSLQFVTKAMTSICDQHSFLPVPLPWPQTIGNSFCIQLSSSALMQSFSAKIAKACNHIFGSRTQPTPQKAMQTRFTTDLAGFAVGPAKVIILS